MVMKFLFMITRAKWVRIWYYADWVCFHDFDTS